METAQQLADTTIEVVPALTQTIAPDGGITFEAADRVEMSLLQVGLNPTFLYALAQPPQLRRPNSVA